MTTTVYTACVAQVLRIVLVALSLIAALVPVSPAWAQDDVAPTAELIPPTLLDEVPADYPPAAFAAGIEADVVVRIEVDENGYVASAEPVGITYFTYDADGYLAEEAGDASVDRDGFIASAVAAVQQYAFTPARTVDPVTGVETAVPVILTWRVGFVIEVEEVAVAVNEGSDEFFGEEGSGAVEAVAVDAEGPVNFRGRLLERGTRAPLPAFRVQLALATADGATIEAVAQTDFDGRFAFRGLPAGDWTVRVEEVDYFSVEATESLSLDELVEVTYFIERNIYGEYVGTSTAERPEREVTRRTIAVSEIQRIPGNNNDAIKVVQSLPGVARAAFGGGDVIIRGSAPEDTGFYIDGVTIPAVYHFGGLRAVFPTELLSGISFLPGGYSVEYGRSTGGIVQVDTNLEAPERVSGHVDTNVFDTGVFVRAPISDRVFVQFGARRSYIDAILLPLSDALELNFTTAPRYYDYQANVVWTPNGNHRFSWLAYGSDDALDVVGGDESDVPPEQRGGVQFGNWFHGVLFRWDSDAGDRVSNAFRLNVYRQAVNFEFGQDVRFDLRFDTIALRDTIEWRAADRFTLRAGFDGEILPGSIYVRAPLPPKEGEEQVVLEQVEITETSEDFTIGGPGVWIDGDVEPVDGLNLIPGLRLDYYEPANDVAVDVRLATRYAVTDALTLKASAGTTHQEPSPDESSEGFGNPDLGVEEAVQYTLGGEYSITSYLEANVEVFYKDLNDLISRSSNTVERDGEYVPEIYNNGGQGRIYGAELLIRHNLNNRFFGWIAYTLSRSERLDYGEESWRLFDFDQTHILTLLGGYNLPRNWSVGAKFRVVTGNPTTPIVGSVYDANSDTYASVPGETNSERTRIFHQLDVRVDKRWIFNRWTLNLYLDLQNAYNRRNQEDVIYNYDYTEQADLTGLPLIPSLGIRAEF